MTGAGGRTGKAVFQTLKAEYQNVEPIGLVRSNKAAKVLKKAGAEPSEIVRADVINTDELSLCMQGCDTVILCTSAVPKIKPLSIAKVMFKKMILRSKDAGRPRFRFSPGGTPQEVDWMGSKLQIDAAVAAGVRKFVLISSMGGTQPDNFLNSIGKQADGSGGDILLWKRKAERYLMQTDLDYTIIHPGGLVDECPRARALIVGVDDELLLQLTSRQVPRNDVARVACAAMSAPKASKLSFDLASKPIGEGTPTDLTPDFFAMLGGKSCGYTDEPIEPPSLPSLQ